MFVFKHALHQAFQSSGSRPSIWTAIKSSFSTMLAALTLTTLVGMLLTINVENTTGFQRYWNNLDYTYVVANVGFDNEVYNPTLPPKLVTDLKSEKQLRVSAMSILFAPYRGQDVIIMAFDPGGPAQPALHTGRYVRNNREVVMDRYLAGDLNLRLGQTVDFFGHPLQLVGLSRDTDAIAHRRIFLTPQAFGPIAGMDEASAVPVNLVMVQGEPSATLRSKWSQNLRFYGRALWLERAATYGDRNFTPLISMMVVMCTLLSLINYGNLIRVQMTRAIKEMAALRTLGATRSQVTLVQTLSLLMQSLVGLLLGLGVAWGAVQIIATATPGFHAGLTLINVGYTSAMMLMVVGLAGVLPLIVFFWRISPAEALRSA